jgi:hypothetical protein
MTGLMAHLMATTPAPAYSNPLARLIKWLRGGPYADVVFA